MLRYTVKRESLNILSSAWVFLQFINWCPFIKLKTLFNILLTDRCIATDLQTRSLHICWRSRLVDSPTYIKLRLRSCHSFFHRPLSRPCKMHEILIILRSTFRLRFLWDSGDSHSGFWRCRGRGQTFIQCWRCRCRGQTFIQCSQWNLELGLSIEWGTCLREFRGKLNRKFQ